MITFIDHDADEIEQNIDVMSEESYEKEKDDLVHQGVIEINQFYNKKMKCVNRETAT